jgi:uncharacterized membrane protein YdjX (TVP38/TMEM64 family)
MISGVVSVVALLCEGVLRIPLTHIVHRLITEPGVSAALAIVLLLSLDLLLPIPSSLVVILSGAMFGTIGGGMLSLLGFLTGNMLGFELTRRYGRGLAQYLVGEDELQKMNHAFARYGTIALLLSRPMPVLMETLSVVAGLSTTSRGTFVLANLLGTIPLCFLYAYAGASARQVQSIVPAVLIGLCTPAVGWIIVHVWGMTSTRRATSAPASTPQRNR